MKKFWSKLGGYLAVGFAFFSAGMAFMYKLMGDQVEINIKRIKTKRGSSEVSVPINLETPEKKKKRRRNRKNDRGKK